MIIGNIAKNFIRKTILVNNLSVIYINWLLILYSRLLQINSNACHTLIFCGFVDNI